MNWKEERSNLKAKENRIILLSTSLGGNRPKVMLSWWL